MEALLSNTHWLRWTCRRTWRRLPPSLIDIQFEWVYCGIRSTCIQHRECCCYLWLMIFLFLCLFLRFSLYSTRYDQRPGAGNAFIISDDITTSRIPKQTLFVVFRTYPRETEAVGALDYCFIGAVELENLTRHAQRENGENKQPDFASYWHFRCLTRISRKRAAFLAKEEAFETENKINHDRSSFFVILSLPMTRNTFEVTINWFGCGSLDGCTVGYKFLSWCCRVHKLCDNWKSL